MPPLIYEEGMGCQGLPCPRHGLPRPRHVLPRLCQPWTGSGKGSRLNNIYILLRRAFRWRIGLGLICCKLLQVRVIKVILFEFDFVVLFCYCVYGCWGFSDYIWMFIVGKIEDHKNFVGNLTSPTNALLVFGWLILPKMGWKLWLSKNTLKCTNFFFFFFFSGLQIRLGYESNDVILKNDDHGSTTYLSCVRFFFFFLW